MSGTLGHPVLFDDESGVEIHDPPRRLAERADWLVCPRDEDRAAPRRSVPATCSRCGAAIHHSRSAPVRPPRICSRCALMLVIRNNLRRPPE